MPSPVKPSDIKETLATTDSYVCTRLKKVLVDFPKAVYAWFSYIYNEDGTFTDDFKDEVCAIDCENIVIPPPPTPCDPETDSNCEPPVGGLEPPRVRAGAAMRHAGGIPLVWPHVTGARSYDLYRADTASTVPASRTLLRKGLIWSDGYSSDRNKLRRRPDNTFLFVDIPNGLAWDSGNAEHAAGSALDGGESYYYWVRAVDVNGNPSGWSKSALGFSRNVTNFDSIGTAALLWSGQEATPLATGESEGVGGLFAKTKMRVTLRSGGGGGAGGGDYNTPVYNKFHITAITHDNTTGDNTFTLDSNAGDHGFKGGYQVTLEGNDNTAWNKKFTIHESMKESNKFKLVAAECVGLGSPTTSTSGTLPDNSAVSHYGTIYATDFKNPVKITGGGGGAGGVVQAVFTIDDLVKVRVRTYDIGGQLVDYTSGSLAEGPTKAKLDDPTNSTHLKASTIPDDTSYFPFNQGGRGRNSASASVGSGVGPPTPGVPASDDKHSKNAPYITVLEISDDTGNSPTWYPILWVSDGEGGGYKNSGDGGNVGIGGQSARPVWWKKSLLNEIASTATTLGSSTTLSNNPPFKAIDPSDSSYVKAQYGYIDYEPSSGGAATLRAAALNGKGIVFYDGGDGINGTVGDPHSGKGGHVWDGLVPEGPPFAHHLAMHLRFDRGGNAFDIKQSPGSGGWGSQGTGEQQFGAHAWGGHALAGCAYLTYATTDYDGA